MLLKDYVKKPTVNAVELADALGVSHQTVYNWIKTDARISGKVGERVVTLTKTKEVREGQ